MTSRPGGPYQVVRSLGFQRQWSQRLEDGRIPSGREGPLETICATVLSQKPWIGATRPGKPSNYRTVLITRLTRHVPEIEIGYTIVEDDKTVSLEDVLSISAN